MMQSVQDRHGLETVALQCADTGAPHKRSAWATSAISSDLEFPLVQPPFEGFIDKSRHYANEVGCPSTPSEMPRSSIAPATPLSHAGVPGTNANWRRTVA